jgi:hypothetical protein
VVETGDLAEAANDGESVSPTLGVEPLDPVQKKVNKKARRAFRSGSGVTHSRCLWLKAARGEHLEATQLKKIGGNTKGARGAILKHVNLSNEPHISHHPFFSFCRLFFRRYFLAVGLIQLTRGRMIVEFGSSGKSRSTIQYTRGVSYHTTNAYMWFQLLHRGHGNPDLNYGCCLHRDVVIALSLGVKESGRSCGSNGVG